MQLGWFCRVSLTALDVTTATTLGIKAGTDPAHSQIILEAFSRYNFAVDGPLPEYVAQVSATTDASPLECALFLEHQCMIVNRSYDKDEIDEWLSNYFSAKERGQSYRIIEIEWLSDFPISSQGPNNLQVPLADAEESVKQAFDAVLQRTDCGGQVTQIPPTRIDGLRLPDEIKVEWEWGYVELDCGGGFHFWKPTTYYRDATAVLYAVGAYPGDLVGAKNKIEKIIRESAEAAAFYALVSGDISTAVTVFKELFTQKVIEAFSNLDRCLTAEIYLVTETGSWHT